MDELKVLILNRNVIHYRVPIFNRLSERCDLTVIYSEGDLPKGMHCNFKTERIAYRKVGPIVWHKANIRKMAQGYDAVIVYGDINWIKHMTLPWFGKVKVAYWTIGVTTTHGYDTVKQKDFLFRFFYRKAAALIFYTDEPIKKYVEHGFERERLFVANNTVEVLPIEMPSHKDYIVFIGTLAKRKGLYLLLESYLTLKEKCRLPKLVIVGDGPEYNNVKDWIRENDMSTCVEMLGRIIDIEKKAEILSKALVCISPKQAGLSVLECMGYGVPFVTTKDAITGGERFNIHNNIDGILMEDESQLKEVLYDIASNPDKYIMMGRKAKEFYDENRTPQRMADELWEVAAYLKERDSLK